MSRLSIIIENIKKLRLDEMEEILFLTNKYITNKKRQIFTESHKESLKEYEEGKLYFSSEVNELKKEGY